MKAQNNSCDAVPSSPKPLDSFAFIRSCNVEEVRAALALVYTRPVLVPRGGGENFDAKINVCELNSVGLAYASFGCAVSLDFPPSGFFSQVLPLAGAGEMVCGNASATLGPGSSALVSSDLGHRSKFSADYEHVSLRISAKALAEKLQALTGTMINTPLRMEPLQHSTHPAAQMLQRYIPLFVDMLSGQGPLYPSRYIAEGEELLMTLFLNGHRHNYSYLMERDPPDAALEQVRLAEEYIEANAQHAVTLEELAKAAGVSAFSLFKAFKTHRGYSPFEFLMQVRSRRAGTAR